MSWSGIFKEAATVGKREITVKRTAYDEEDAVAIETWSDLTLFKVRGLNHLRVSGFGSMTSLPPNVAQLNSLLELILVENGLTTLPEELGALSKLRVLDVSNNRLSVLPQSFYSVSSLQTVLLSHNQLTVDSFPPCLSEPFPGIQYIDLVGNKLTTLPEFVYKSRTLLELKASHNVVEALSPEIEALTSLKLIEMHNNSLQDIPSELSHCSKLKFLLFDENPIKDPRLRKILSQFGSTKPKAVLDYLGTKSKTKGKKKGKGKTKQSRDLSDSDEEISTTGGVVSSSKIAIKIVRPETFIEVKATHNARQIRPYLVCAIIRDLNLQDDFGDNFRKFITLQTKIHDTVCKKRRLSTIATHCLDSMSPPIIYKCAMAHKIHFCPLDWKECTTARKYLDHLRANKPDEAKKPSNGKPYSVDAAASHISKYLSMVDPNQMVFLEDSSKKVISLPPLTNSEDTKITEKSRNIFIEVTSSTSLADAKDALDALLIGMAQSRLLSAPPIEDVIGASDAVMGACPPPPSQQMLLIEPVKVVDEANKLLVHYPSRNDLPLNDRTQETLQVLRPV